MKQDYSVTQNSAGPGAPVTQNYAGCGVPVTGGGGAEVGLGLPTWEAARSTRVLTNRHLTKAARVDWSRTPEVEKPACLGVINTRKLSISQKLF